MKNDKTRYLLCILFFTILAAITFRCVWPADHVFFASDMNIGRLALKKYSLPEQLTGVYGSSPILGSSLYRYMFYNVLTALLPLSVMANWFYGLALVVGSAAVVWFLRMWGRSWLASILGALIGFWFNSIMLAAGGHTYKIEVLVFSALTLCFSEKAIRSDSVWKALGFSLFTGITVGIMMLEQQDVALLAGLFVGSYTIFRLVQLHGRSFSRWIAVLVPIAVVALLLSGEMVLKSYDRNIAGAAQVQGEGNEKWNYVTQWSMVPGEWPDLIASGWSGWGSNNPKGPYWGKIGQSSEWEATQQGFRNFKITSVYFGIIPFLLGAFGFAMAIQNRKDESARVTIFWSIAGLVGFWLAFGKYSLLYKLFYQLPVVGNIRAPMKFLDNFQICLGLVAAYGIDCMLQREGRGKATQKFAYISAGISGLMLLAGLRYLLAPASQISIFSDMGFSAFAQVMVKNMSTAWFHAAVLAFICSVLLWVLAKKTKGYKYVVHAFIGVLAIDSLLLTSHYFKATNINPVKQGNVVINYLKENQGNERAYFLDQSGIYNQWLASDGPYHQLNIFNIWQYPRMPVEYQNYLTIVGKNQIRLWELSSIKHIAMPSDAYKQISQNPQLKEMFKLVLNYQVPTQQGMRNDILLEFKGAIPRLAIFQGWNILPLDQQCKALIGPEHNAQSMVMLEPDSGLNAQVATTRFQPVEARVTKKSAEMKVNVTQASIVRFAQRYQSGWKVFVDGKAAPLLKVDYLCLGVYVPPGEHTVVFKCPSALPKALFALGVLLVSISAGIVLIWRDRKKLK